MKTDLATRIIASVGLRPLAVVTPLETWLSSERLAPPVQVELLATARTRARESAQIRDWLLDRHPDVSVPEPAALDDIRSSTSDTKGAAATYFLLNAGMSHEVARAALALPDHTQCLASDDALLYEWPLLADAESARKRRLVNLGIERTSSLLLAHRVHYDPQAAPPPVSARVQQWLLAANLHGRWNLQRAVVPEAPNGNLGTPIGRLDARLVWVTECTGRVFVLCDLMLSVGHRDQPEAARRAERAELLTTYRSLLDEAQDEFTPVIFTDWSALRDRARIDRVEQLYVHAKDDQNADTLRAFADGSGLPRPKRVLPKHLRAALEVHERLVPDSLAFDGDVPVLVTTLGDNIAPTLTALLSSAPGARCVLCYDKHAPYIAWVARRIREVLRPRDARQQRTAGAPGTGAVGHRASWSCEPKPQGGSIARTAARWSAHALHRESTVPPGNRSAWQSSTTATHATCGLFRSAARRHLVGGGGRAGRRWKRGGSGVLLAVCLGLAHE